MLMKKDNFQFLKKGGFRFPFTGPPKLEANHLTSLLNTDYKIAAKAVARRIEQILNQKK